MNPLARILIVDDTPVNIRILMEALRGEYTIIVATNGERALKLAGGDAPPDLILLDVIMPDMSGYEVCAALKQNPRTAGIPIIFSTGLSEESDKQKGFDLGASDYILKPYSSAVVRARVRNHLELKAYRANLDPVVLDQNYDLAKPMAAIEVPGLMGQWLELNEYRGVSLLFDEADMLDRFDNDYEFIQTILEESLHDLPLQLEHLRELFKSGDSSSIHHHTHTMKGMAANISTPALSEICFMIENAAKGGALNVAWEMFPELERTILLTMEAIRSVVVRA